LTFFSSAVHARFDPRHADARPFLGTRLNMCICTSLAMALPKLVPGPHRAPRARRLDACPGCGRLTAAGAGVRDHAKVGGWPGRLGPPALPGRLRECVRLVRPLRHGLTDRFSRGSQLYTARHAHVPVMRSNSCPVLFGRWLVLAIRCHARFTSLDLGLIRVCRQSLANFTVDAVDQLGYDGAWFDSFSPSEVRNGADPAGNKVSVWNPATQARYTLQESYDAQQARLQRVWKEVHARLSRHPVIWANNFENWFPTAQGPGDRFFMINSTGNRPFDGCSLESWTAGFDGSCTATSTSFWGHFSHASLKSSEPPPHPPHPMHFLVFCHMRRMLIGACNPMMRLESRLQASRRPTGPGCTISSCSTTRERGCRG